MGSHCQQAGGHIITVTVPQDYVMNNYCSTRYTDRCRYRYAKKYFKKSNQRPVVNACVAQ